MRAIIVIKKSICFLAILVSILSITNVSAQQGKPVSDIDFVQIINGKKAEAMFFYETNWKPLRQAALEKGYISSYKLFTTSADSVANFNIVLITEYKDAIQYNAREENFRLIMKAISPGGPKLLNEVKPADFRKTLFSRKAFTEYGN